MEKSEKKVWQVIRFRRESRGLADTCGNKGKNIRKYSKYTNLWDICEENLYFYH